MDDSGVAFSPSRHNRSDAASGPAKLNPAARAEAEGLDDGVLDWMKAVEEADSASATTPGGAVGGAGGDAAQSPESKESPSPGLHALYHGSLQQDMSVAAYADAVVRGDAGGCVNDSVASAVSEAPVRNPSPTKRAPTT